ncbi:MAG TPA: heparin lyase I family protein [Solirubrobacterales bacterium]
MDRAARKSLGVALAAALLLLAAVLATGAGADSGRAPGRSAAVAGTAHRRALQPSVSAGLAVTKPHHPHRKHRKHRKHPHQPSPPAPTPAPAPEPPGQLLFGSNFDGSFRPWIDVQSLAERATISTAHPFDGSGAGRFEVRPGDVEPQTGDQRSEVSGPDFNAGEDIYVRDEIRVPDGYTFQGPWQLINQLHEEEWSGSPGIATFLDASRTIRFGAGDGYPTYWQGPQLEPERWYTLVYRVNLSKDPTQGFVELWFDGVQQVLSNGATRMYGETIQTSQTYIKAGIYRSQFSTGVSVIEHDDIAVGTGMGAVMAF